MPVENYLDLGGTFRSRSAEQTYTWLKSLMPQIGVTRVANVTGLDHIGIATAVCIRPNAKHLSVSQGKGQSLTLAKISAMMESLEGYHAENPPPVTTQGSYVTLKDNWPVIDPEIFPGNSFERVNLQQENLSWVTATDLFTNKECLIPHSLVQIDSTVYQREQTFFHITSNGLAAGNTEDEAICHALFEIIERDALFNWQQLSSTAREQALLDLNTVNEPANQQLLTQFHQAQMHVRVWDLQSVVGLPAFQCAIYDKNALRDLGIFTGSGCHLNKSVALSRALTEAAQSRLTFISGSRDDLFPQLYLRRKTVNVALQTKHQQGIVDYQKIAAPTLRFDFAADKHFLLEVLRQNGHDRIFLVRHIKAELSVPVVQLFVPSLHFFSTRT